MRGVAHVDRAATPPGGGVEAVSDAECAVCLGAFVEEDELRSLPCGHFYHKRCIDDWLLRRGQRLTADQIVERTPSCPLCRVPLFSGIIALDCRLM